MSSPDHSLVFSFKLLKTAPTYAVQYKGKLVLDDAPLQLRFDNGDFGAGLLLQKPSVTDTIETYDLPFGKASHISEKYTRLILPLQEKSAPFRKINIVVKVFNDGLAFRYEFPEQENWKTFNLLDEVTSFNFTGNPMVKALLLPNYTSSHEGLYTTLPLDQIKEDTLMDMPALFELPGKIFVGITEAALLDYSGMYLSRKNHLLVSKLSPLPSTPEVKVKAILPHHSPWRVLLISDRVGALVESTILTSLNAPSKIKDISWLKPGKTTFPWWNGNVLPDTINAPGNNFVTAKYYIDFCARNQIDYHSVVEYGLHQWYMDDGVGFQPGPNADPTKPVPGLDMKEICDYGASVGVGIRVWVQWAALYPKLDSAFAAFERWGLKGMMIDFMDRDDQEMVNIQTEMLEKAAAHHLHIQFHGAYKPTGINRTYPNEFTREGTLNYEVDKWTDTGLTPDHDLDIAFTRLLAGSTDYHLGGFRAAPPSKFRAQYTRPLVLGTRCHMLAMYVVLENYLQMVCDYPAAYEGQDGFEFIRSVPTTWDQTKVIGAAPGEFISIARRKGHDWYLGTINNHASRTISIPLNFLEEGNYAVEIFEDGEDVQTNPDQLVKKNTTLSGKDNITLTLAGGGGTAIHFRKL